jgi:hypothetical protein
MGNESSYYYNRVVVAGNTEYVQAFLECYDLTVKYNPSYASSRQIWAACNEIAGGGQSQTVCVAIDSNGREADSRIFSTQYATRVAGTVFNLD